MAWHDLRYGKHAMRRSRNAICLFGLKVRPFLHHHKEIASCHNYGFQASLELEKQHNSQPH